MVRAWRRTRRSSLPWSPRWCRRPTLPTPSPWSPRRTRRSRTRVRRTRRRARHLLAASRPARRMRSSRAELRDEAVAGETAAAEVDRAREPADEVHRARSLVDGDANGLLRGAVTEPVGPEVVAVRAVELRDKVIAASGRGQSTATEIDRAAEVAGDDHVAGRIGAHRLGVCLRAGGTAEGFAPHVS